jgi:hypothetical protein
VISPQGNLRRVIRRIMGVRALITPEEALRIVQHLYSDRGEQVPKGITVHETVREILVRIPLEPQLEVLLPPCMTYVFNVATGGWYKLPRR